MQVRANTVRDTTIQQIYSVSKVNLQFFCEDRELLRKVVDFIETCFYFKKEKASSYSIKLELKAKSNSSYIPPPAEELFHYPPLRGFRLNNYTYIYITDDKSLFKLNLSSGAGWGFISQNFWKKPLKSKRDFILLPILMLLRPLGLYALPANGLVKDGVGVLFVGGSGCGKSAQAVGLIREGWSYLSDEVLLLEPASQGIEAIALRKGFSLEIRLAYHYPELEEALLKAPIPLEGRKGLVDIEPVYPGKFSPRCLPQVLIFPGISYKPKSYLSPLEALDSLKLLIRYSAGIMLEKHFTINQLEVLEHLSYQAKSYRLALGWDIYKNPSGILELLSEVGL